MGKATGFMEYQRTEASHRDPLTRITDYAPFLLPSEEETMHIQSARCMDCGVPFCHAGMVVAGATIGCPLGNLIPEINDLVYRGDWEAAYARLSLTHPFPEITGRVCPALCEGSCTAGQVCDPVAIKDIERSIAAHGLGKGRKKLGTLPKTGKTVAIIGSGPAGLAAADTLSGLGHSVTVFEQDDRPGGLLMYGIPNMKLEKDIIDARIALLEAQEVTFRLNCRVGSDISAARLMDEFDGVVLCIGARNQRRLQVPGADATGVYTAMEYLTASTKQLLDGVHPSKSLYAAGKQVIVVGGGDTGTDCIATAIRQGAAGIAALEIMPALPETRGENNPWPLWPRIKKTDYGHEEAIAVYGRDVREYETTLKEIIAENGVVTGAVTVRVTWKKGADGRLIPTELPETQTIRKADLILTAMGFTGAEKELPEKMQLPTTSRDTVSTTEGDSTGKGGFATHLPGVFAAGDVRRGPSLVVWAIQEGLRAGRECHRYLQKLK